jgi:hypothetical protein
MDKKQNKYIINPLTGRPVILFGKQHTQLIKENILKDKLVKAPVLQFDKNETPEVLDKVKAAMPKKDGSFVVRFKNKIITKNVKLTNEQLIDYIIDKYPHMLEKVLEQVCDTDTDEQIREKFSYILHQKLIS